MKYFGIVTEIVVFLGTIVGKTNQSGADLLQLANIQSGSQLEVKARDMMTWKEYEDAVLDECRRVCDVYGADIKKNVHLRGTLSGVLRQIDILVTFPSLDSCSTIVIEAKHYSRKVTVKIVESFIGFLEDLGFENGVMVTEKGYSKAATNRAIKGRGNVTVEILSLSELQQFQAEGTIVYSGEVGMVMPSAFGWIIDGTRRDLFPAVFYRRGVRFEEATKREKEWMYIQFWKKDADVGSIRDLEAIQNESLFNEDTNASISLQDVEGLSVRIARLASYPTPEITVFREFPDFIAFIVAYSPDEHVNRDVKKAVYMLSRAIPVHVRRDEQVD